MSIIIQGFLSPSIITQGYNSTSVTPTYLTFSGPDTGFVGVQSSQFYVYTSKSYSGTISLSDSGGGGTFSPSSLTFSNSTFGIFRYTPNSSGTKSISVSAQSVVITGSPRTFTVGTTLTLTASNVSGTIGFPITGFTVTPSGPITANVTLSDGGSGGIFTPSSLTFSNSSTPQTFTYTPSQVGTFYVQISNNSFINEIGSPLLVISSPTTATLTMTGTTFTGVKGTPITGFTVTPSAPITTTVYLSDGNFNGTFSPATLTFTNSSTPQTFSYTAFKDGTYRLSIRNSNGVPQVISSLTVSIPFVTKISQPLWSQASSSISLSSNVAKQIITPVQGNQYLIQNTGSGTIYLGGSNVSATTGFPLAANATFPIGGFAGVPTSYYAFSATNTTVSVTTVAQNVFIPFYSN